jgi:KaiC/GvpD/RAD55 family RecA-like ATPase
MLTPLRSLSLNFEAGKALPHIPALERLYRRGLELRHGQVVMIAGRSGSQKSGFALWLVDQLDLPTLYFSADMSAFTASARVASTRTGLTTEQVEQAMSPMGDPDYRRQIHESLKQSKIKFSFGSPITLRQVDEEIEAYVEYENNYPQIIVFDNLMDFQGAENDYAAQMEVMSMVTELSRITGAMVVILHHASDKTWSATSAPWNPPSRDQIKNGLSEKPEVTLSCALDPHTRDFRIAILKQRMGWCDPTANVFDIFEAEPELTRFHEPYGLRSPSRT